MKTAIITGISGQGGAYLAKTLLEKHYRVIGTTRDLRGFDDWRLQHLGIDNLVEIKTLDLSELKFIEDLVEDIQPDEIYHLASPSSVERSFKEPNETITDIVISTSNLLESVRKINSGIRFFNAASSEMFGHADKPTAENETLKPSSPYGVAKASAFLQTKNYREAYGMFAVSGILYNFESPLRSQNYVTKKIINHACRISMGEDLKLNLGNIEIIRDWGWAPEYMEAVSLMLQLNTPHDINIATGKEHTLNSFIKKSFEFLGLNYKNHVVINEEYFRPLDIASSRADVSRAKSILNWQAEIDLEFVIKRMIETEMALQNSYNGNSKLRLVTR